MMYFCVNDLRLFCDAVQREGLVAEHINEDLPVDAVADVLLRRDVGLLGIQWVFGFCLCFFVVVVVVVERRNEEIVASVVAVV